MCFWWAVGNRIERSNYRKIKMLQSCVALHLNNGQWLNIWASQNWIFMFAWIYIRTLGRGHASWGSQVLSFHRPSPVSAPPRERLLFGRLVPTGRGQSRAPLRSTGPPQTRTARWSSASAGPAGHCPDGNLELCRLAHTWATDPVTLGWVLTTVWWRRCRNKDSTLWHH